MIMYDIPTLAQHSHPDGASEVSGRGAAGASAPAAALRVASESPGMAPRQIAVPENADTFASISSFMFDPWPVQPSNRIDRRGDSAHRACHSAEPP